MIVEQLDIVKYETENGPWRSITFNSPNWNQIEAAIINLDQVLLPMVNLNILLSTECEYGPKHLNILGGNNIYHIQGIDINCKTGGFMNLEQNSKIVEVWKSDQGFNEEETYICKEITVVLQIAKYYCETGLFHPLFIWEEW
jgi:hypothetical protein